MYVNNKRIGDVAELLCFSTPQEKFYRVTHTNGYVECLDGRQVYVTRTPVDQIGSGVWDYLRKLADETGLCDEEGNNSLAKGYACVDVKRDNVPLAQYLGAKRKLAVRALPKVVYYLRVQRESAGRGGSGFVPSGEYRARASGHGENTDDSQHHCEFALGGQNGVGGVEQ